MKNISNTLKENKWLHYFIIIIIGIILSIPLKDIQLRDTHDGIVHIVRIISTVDTIKTGEFPVIVAPYYCNAAGYAMTLFYPPLVTYIPLLFKLITPTYSIALKVFGAICIILSGITMYNFVFQVTKKRSIALFSAIIYLISPYKLGNIYKRYAIGEFVALIFLPVLFQGMHSLFKEDGKRHYYIAIGASLLMLSHTITTLYSAIFCALYMLFYFQKLKDKKVIIKLLINFIFIMAITMLFYIPMFEAKQHADYSIFSNAIMRTTNWYAKDNSIQLSEFFKDIGKENATTYIIGIPTFILLLSTLFTIKKVNIKYKDIYVIFMLFAFISAYMCTKFFPWLLMPDFLCKLQYPWRMMGFFSFFVSLICGTNLYILLSFIKKDYVKIIIFTILTIVSIFYTLPIVKQYKTLDNTLDEIYENWVIGNEKISHYRVNRDYLPVRAILLQDTYMLTREDITYVLKGQANIQNEKKDKLTSTMEVEDVLKDTILEFPYIYYPGYEVTVTENNIKTELKTFESKNGYVAVKLAKDIKQANIEVTYEPTVTTKLSYIGSLISIIMFIIYIYSENKEK